GQDASRRVVAPGVGSAGQEERDEPLRRARQLGVAGRLRFDGALPIDRVFRAYREADLFVLPCLPGEGVPRVLLEAMAASLPLVTTRVAGIPEAVDEGRTGLLVEPGPSEALTAALRRLPADAGLRRALSATGPAA